MSIEYHHTFIFLQDKAKCGWSSYGRYALVSMWQARSHLGNFFWQWRIILRRSNFSTYSERCQREQTLIVLTLIFGILGIGHCSLSYIFPKGAQCALIWFRDDCFPVQMKEMKSALVHIPCRFSPGAERLLMPSHHTGAKVILTDHTLLIPHTM